MRNFIDAYVTMLTQYALNVLLTILTFSLVTLFLHMKRRHTYWKKRGIRTLPGHWFFGHFKDALLMRKSAGVVLGNLHRQAADEDDVVGFYILDKPFLLVRNPVLIKQMLIKDFHIFSDRHFSGQSTDIGSLTLFSINNPRWKWLRSKMTPVFTSGKMKKLFPLMVESAEAMRLHLRDQFKGDSKDASFTVNDTFCKYVTNVIASLAFGIRINCFDTPAPEFYTYSIKASEQNFVKSVQFFVLFFFPNIGKHFRSKMLGDSTDYFREIFWRSWITKWHGSSWHRSQSLWITKKIMKTCEKRGDLIDCLMDMMNDPANTEFHEDTLLAQAAIFFAAGRETSITTMTYALCELAKKPEMQKRLRQEILEKIEAANDVTYEAVQDMKYLHQVINETLRMYPPVPILDRVSLEDYTFPGTKTTVEKDTPIYIALYGLHTDPRYHRDPMTFDPDRFSDERKSEILPCTYMPFGAGPRHCIGMRLGDLQTAVGLITVLRDYEVALNPSWLCTVDDKNVLISPPMGFKLNLKQINITHTG